MIKETYSIRSKKNELSIVNNKINAVNKSDIIKTGMRLYHNGFIGVAGAIGAYDENKLYDRAKQMLNFNVPYDCEPANSISRTEDLTGDFTLSDKEYLEKSQELLEMLTARYPQFTFNHKFTYYETETGLHNELGANLIHRDKSVQNVLMFKHRESNNLFDSFGASFMRGYDLNDAFNTITESCACYDEKVPLPEEKMPVVFLLNHDTVLGKFFNDLNGRVLGAKASMFEEKIGQKLFADNFSLYVDRGPRTEYQCFFDAEGTVLPNDRFPLIENGVLKSPFSSKKIAKQYGYAVTGSAGGEYNSVPDTSMESIHVQGSGKTIKELLGGRKALYMVIASGGDFTPQGEFASPVQAAFLFDGERLLGRLPQISMRSNIYDMFGKDFIGLSTDSNSLHNPYKYLVMDMQLSTIGGWL